LIRWKLDTCYCIILCESPSKRGTFQQRCRIHPKPKTTLDVYAHNLSERLKSSEITNDNQPTKAGETRIQNTREATRP